jgi:TrmH family RNA methyltransferase
VLISSRANERVKAVRALRDRKQRDATGVFFVEGSRLLQAALDHAAEIKQLVVAPERLSAHEMLLLEKASRRRPDLLEVTGEVFDSLSFREERQALGAVVRQRWERLSDTTGGRRCWLAVQDIQHPGNLGTLLRTCDAIGGDGAIICGRSTDPYHPIAVRGSLGAVFSQRIVRATWTQLERWLLLQTYQVIGTSPSGGLDYREVRYRAPVAIVSGNERTGLTEEQEALCEAVVRIPMAGYVESLNLSVATALVLYEVYRQLEAPG